MLSASTVELALSELTSPSAAIGREVWKLGGRVWEDGQVAMGQQLPLIRKECGSLLTETRYNHPT